MTRLLVFGFAPLPFENTLKNFGPGIRAWQFIKPLLSTGSADVTLIANRIPFIYPAETFPEVFSHEHGFSYYNMSDSEFANTHRIQEIHDQFKPDAILVATVFAGTPLSHIRTDSPIWFDLFGHVMAEAQAKAYRYQNDEFLDHFRRHALLALQSGDKFSTVSRAQASATVGELGLIGRLTAATTGYSFCDPIPCAMESTLYTHDKCVIRGREVPDNAFIVLWSGGFNTWTDTETLVDGLEQAMAQNSDIWFVSTGGQIDGHDEITYPAFVNRVKKSHFASRFVLKGWVPKEDVHNYYFEADIGINIDRYMYEGVFGSKNRVLDWLRAGLPSLIGELCELSLDLPERGLAYSYPLGNPEALASKILALTKDPEAVAETGKRARDYGLKHLSFDATTQPFQNWLSNPVTAPDHRQKRKTLAHKDPLQWSDQSYIRKLESELDGKNRHLQSLEHYIRHLESELRKRNPAENPYNQLPVNRPALNGRPLKLPEQALVSIVVVTWNGVKDIEACIRSAKDQDYPHVECVVVDNGSRDGTPEFIETNFSDIHLIRNKKNQGFTGGVNQGILATKGDVIFLLNQDAVMMPGLLKELIEVLEDDTIAIAGCKIYNIDGKTLQHAGGILHENGLTDHYGAGQIDTGQYDQDRDVDYVTGAVFAFKRSLIDEIGLFDRRFHPAYYEELDYCIRASRSGYRIRYCHRAEALHHESTSTGKFSPRFYRLYHRNRLKLILKHFTFRYFWGCFLRSELTWFRKYAPREQWLPLCIAYICVSHRIAWLSIKTLKGKLMG